MSKMQHNQTNMSEFYDIKRNVHRVFRAREKVSVSSLLNPFRHLPWGYEGLECRDPEKQAQRKPPAEPKKYYGIKFLEPEVPFTPTNQILRTFVTSWINFLLICVPIGFILNYLKGPSVETFAINYIAAVPLWFMCDFGFEEIHKRIGGTASDLLNIFTSNMVQVISSIQLLKARQVSVLQTSLIGSILSNILVLLGLSILLGGATKQQQYFNRTGAQGSSSLLSIAATSLLIPTAVHQLHQSTDSNIVLQSRGVAIVLVFIYVAYTWCQLKTHKDIYHTEIGVEQAAQNGDSTSFMSAEKARTAIAKAGATAAIPVMEPPVAKGDGRGHDQIDIHSHFLNKVKLDDEVHGPHLHGGVAVATFASCVVLLYFCLDAVVNSIDALTQQTSLTPTFVGLILLPIPNCDFAPISLAVEDRLEQTMKYTVGRSIQTALLVEPMVILLAWWMHVFGVTLAFDGFQVVSLFTTILLLNFLVVDAKVHWIHGILLLADWLLIAIAAYFVISQIPT